MRLKPFPAELLGRKTILCVAPFGPWAHPCALCPLRLQRERHRPLGPGPAGLPPHAEDQTHADLLQTPSAADNEILLCHQPQPGRKGLKAAGPENGPDEESSAGKQRDLLLIQSDRPISVCIPLLLHVSSHFTPVLRTSHLFELGSLVHWLLDVYPGVPIWKKKTKLLKCKRQQNVPLSVNTGVWERSRSF